MLEISSKALRFNIERKIEKVGVVNTAVYLPPAFFVYKYFVFV